MYRILVPVLAFACFITSCSKNSSSNDITTTPGIDPGPEPDYSNCLLAGVQYLWVQGMPGMRDNFTLEYDSLKRVKQRSGGGFFNVYNYDSAGKIIQITYINGLSVYNMTERYVYTLDNNGRIVSHTTASYNKTSSIDAYTRKDKTVYEYDAEGHVIKQKVYAYGYHLMQERKFTWQAGNLVQRENLSYDISVDPSVYQRSDTVLYSYDDKPFFPEAVYLYEVTNLQTGTPNKNNITGILLKIPNGENGMYDRYKSIQYGYEVKGKRLGKVTMSATTQKGESVTTSVGFTYKCD